jgi:ParB family chromosome partitioning protein
MSKNPPAFAALPVYKDMTIPLCDLVLSEDNVRKSDPSKKGIEELAATIKSQGQLSALSVSLPVKGGSYHVEAGGRRLRALQLLASQGHIAMGYPIKCQLVTKAEAKAVSLTENFGQESMHPSDEFQAFQDLKTEGKTVEGIAKMYGQSVLHIQRRLKLAAVSPKLMDEFRKGNLTLDQIMAFAQSDDHARQTLVWKSLGQYNNSAQVIRRKLQEDEVAAADDRVKLVGLKSYIAAGGEVRRDLFSENGKEEFLTDPLLLDMLVAELLQLKSDELQGEGCKWVEVIPEDTYAIMQSFCEFPPTYFPETPEHVTKRDALKAQLKEAMEKYQATEDEDEETHLDELMDELKDRMDALADELILKSGIDKSVSGALVILDGSKINVKRGMLRTSERKAVMAKLSAQKSGESSEDSDSEAQETAEVFASIPERLMLNLSAHRTAAIQASMLDRQSVSIAALATQMAFSVFRAYIESPVKVSLSNQWHSLEKASPTVVDSLAGTAMSMERARLESLLPEDKQTWFAWFMAQPQEISLSMIVFATAQTVNATMTSVNSTDHAAQLSKALNIEMTQWWKPTAENYLDLIPKAKMIEAVTEAKGAQAAQGMDKFKKAEAIAHAAEALKESDWLPVPLRSF